MPLTAAEIEKLQTALEWTDTEYYFPGDIISIVLKPETPENQKLLREYIAEKKKENPDLNIREDSTYGYRVTVIGHLSIGIIAGKSGLNLDAATLAAEKPEISVSQLLSATAIENAAADNVQRSTTGTFKLGGSARKKKSPNKKPEKKKEPETLQEIFDGAYLLEGFDNGTARVWVVFRETEQRRALLEKDADGKHHRMLDLFEGNPPKADTVTLSGRNGDTRQCLSFSKEWGKILKRELQREGIELPEAYRVNLKQHQQIMEVLLNPDKKEFPRVKDKNRPSRTQATSPVAEEHAEPVVRQKWHRTALTPAEGPPPPTGFGNQSEIMRQLQEAYIVEDKTDRSNVALHIPASANLDEVVSALFFYHPAQYDRYKYADDILEQLTYYLCKHPPLKGPEGYHKFVLPRKLAQKWVWQPGDPEEDFYIPIFDKVPDPETKRASAEIPRHAQPVLNPSLLRQHGRLVREEVGSHLLIYLNTIDNDLIVKRLPQELEERYKRSPTLVTMRRSGGKKDREYLRLPISEEEHEALLEQGVPTWNDGGLISARKLATAMRTRRDPKNMIERLAEGERLELRASLHSRAWIVQNYGVIKGPQLFLIPPKPSANPEHCLHEVAVLLRPHRQGSLETLKQAEKPPGLKRFGVIRALLTEEQAKLLETALHVPVYPSHGHRMPIDLRVEDWVSFFEVVSKRAEHLQRTQVALKGGGDGQTNGR